MNPLSILVGSGALSNPAISTRDPGMSIDPGMSDPGMSGNVEGGTAVLKGGKGKGGINYGTGVYSPEQSARVLDNMQKFKTQRENAVEFSPLDQHLLKAIAYGTGDPTDLLNIQKQQELNAKEAFDMQMQIEQFKANQERQKRFEAQRQAELYGNPVSGTGTGGTSGYGNIAGASGQGTLNIPPEIRRLLINAETKEEYDKILNTWAQEAVKQKEQFENTAASYEQKDYYDPKTGKMERYTPLEYKNILQNRGAKSPDLPVPQSAATPAPETKNDSTLKAIQNGVFATESSSGSNTKPSIQGAVGQMQITPDTFQTAKNLKLIPQNYDINNPAQNKAAGDALLGYYYDKYNGDVDKVFAAYHGGEGAINKDGTINLNRKDALGTTIADYIARGRKNAGLDKTEISAVPNYNNLPADVKQKLDNAKTEDEYNAILANASQTKSGFTGQSTQVASTELPYSQYQVQHEAETKGLTREMEETGKDIALRKAATIQSASNADENMAANQYVNNLITTNPRAFGVLQHPTVLSAFEGMLEAGTSGPGIGHAQVKSIDDAVRKAMPGATESDIIAAQKAAQKFALLQLNAAKVVLKGQGSVSDNERLLVARMTGSIENSPAAIRDMLQWGTMRYAYDKKIGEMHDNWERSHPNQSYRQFELTPEYKAAKAQYKQQIDAFAEKAGNYQAPSAKVKPMVKPPGYDEWKRSQQR